MKIITIKANDLFFNQVTELARKFSLSKSELIRRAIKEYEQTMLKNELKIQLKNASINVRKANNLINQDFNETIKDGLKNV